MDTCLTWCLPENSVDEEGWSNFEINTLRFKGHPQETMENSVDLAHHERFLQTSQSPSNIR